MDMAKHSWFVRKVLTEMWECDTIIWLEEQEWQSNIFPLCRSLGMKRSRMIDKGVDNCEYREETYGDLDATRLLLYLIISKEGARHGLCAVLGIGKERVGIYREHV